MRRDETRDEEEMCVCVCVGGGLERSGDQMRRAERSIDEEEGEIAALVLKLRSPHTWYGNMCSCRTPRAP
eukprot:768668-Hanusia_phi.AAC.2